MYKQDYFYFIFKTWRSLWRMNIRLRSRRCLWRASACATTALSTPWRASTARWVGLPFVCIHCATHTFISVAELHSPGSPSSIAWALLSSLSCFPASFEKKEREWMQSLMHTSSPSSLSRSCNRSWEMWSSGNARSRGASWITTALDSIFCAARTPSPFPSTGTTLSPWAVVMESLRTLSLVLEDMEAY